VIGIQAKSSLLRQASAFVKSSYISQGFHFCFNTYFEKKSKKRGALRPAATLMHV
jgi:hypothetical protein